jgi:hypothetical protein
LKHPDLDAIAWSSPNPPGKVNGGAWRRAELIRDALKARALP